MGNENLDIAEINRDLQESYIHYDPTRIDYTVSDLEIELIEQAGSSIWKDVFIATLGLGLPTLINGYTDFSKLNSASPLTKDIFINFLVAGVTLILSLISFLVWQKNKKNLNKIIGQIKNKPKYKIPSQTS